MNFFIEILGHFISVLIFFLIDRFFCHKIKSLSLTRLNKKKKIVNFKAPKSIETTKNFNIKESYR